MMRLQTKHVGLILVSLFAAPAQSDNILDRFEGDMLPYDPKAGWDHSPCEPPCSESVENGRFVLRWNGPGGRVGYAKLLFFEGEDPPPPSFWAEWRFRSNHPKPANSFDCDATFAVLYIGVVETVNIYGDAAISFDGDGFLPNLSFDTFHTYRFESPDGYDFRFSVDGTVFWTGRDSDPIAVVGVDFRGTGGCIQDFVSNKHNEWDYVRYGAMEYGESIVASDPPSGFLDPDLNANLDRFVVTFDAPNYAYIDDIAVETTGGETPNVTATRRREPPDPLAVDDDPRILEIVLDRPLPPNETTRFIFSDGETTNIVRYTLQWADTNGDGAIDLRDAAALQSCYGSSDLIGDCRSIDFDGSGSIAPPDLGPFFNTYLLGPEAM